MQSINYFYLTLIVVEPLVALNQKFIVVKLRLYDLAKHLKSSVTDFPEAVHL